MSHLISLIRTEIHLVDRFLTYLEINHRVSIYNNPRKEQERSSFIGADIIG